ncbi:unnamed protein product [Ixodes persulcatus]
MRDTSLKKNALSVVLKACFTCKVVKGVQDSFALFSDPLGTSPLLCFKRFVNLRHHFVPCRFVVRALQTSLTPGDVVLTLIEERTRKRTRDSTRSVSWSRGSRNVAVVFRSACHTPGDDFSSFASSAPSPSVLSSLGLPSPGLTSSYCLSQQPSSSLEDVTGSLPT